MNILEILGNIGFDWRIAFANLVNFLIIFYLLKRYAFGPIGRILDERRRKIEEGLEHAREAETNLMMAKEERARDEAAQILNKAALDAEKQKKEMEQEVLVQAVDLMVEGAGRILREEVSRDRGERIIREMLART